MSKRRRARQSIGLLHLILFDGGVVAVVVEVVVGAVVKTAGVAFVEVVRRI